MKSFNILILIISLILYNFLEIQIYKRFKVHFILHFKYLI